MEIEIYNKSHMSLVKDIRIKIWEFERTESTKNLKIWIGVVDRSKNSEWSRTRSTIVWPQH